ncbi:MAG: AAA family ATPase [Oscillospiraceae bacterium]
MASKVIMIASGKGGTGKSTVCVFLGAELAARGNRVLLIELDSGLRSVDIIAGVYGKTVYDIEDVMRGRCDADKAVVESPIYKGLSVISAPYSGGAIDTSALKIITNKLGEVFDIILIDTAAGMGAPFEAASAVCYTALLVLTPDPVTLRDGRIVADALFDAGRAEVRLIINKVEESGVAQNGIKDLDECIDTVGAQLIGVLPQSSDIMSAAANGTALKERTKAKQAFKNIAARVCGEDVPLIIR